MSQSLSIGVSSDMASVLWLHCSGISWCIFRSTPLSWEESNVHPQEFFRFQLNLVRGKKRPMSATRWYDV